MKMVVDRLMKRLEKSFDLNEGKSVESAGSERVFPLLTYLPLYAVAHVGQTLFVSVVTPSPR